MYGIQILLTQINSFAEFGVLPELGKATDELDWT